MLGKFLCHQFNKSVNTGLFFNWLVAKSIVKFMILMLISFAWKSEKKHEHIEFDNTCGYKSVEK